MALGNVPADRIAQGLRTIEIGKALGQVQRARLRGELGHLGENSDADIRQLAGDHEGSLLCTRLWCGAGELEDSPIAGHEKKGATQGTLLMLKTHALWEPELW
nr:hypothetical protein GCM10020185_18350 [Pseudomonas brassicacearum subsp. brassicacearum]